MEIIYVKVRSRAHRFRMVVKPFVQRNARIDVIPLTAFSRSIGNSFTNINWTGELSVTVYLSENLIRQEITGVVERVHAGSNKGLRRQGEHFGFKECVCGTFSKMPFIKRVERRVYRIIVSVSH